MVLLGSSACLQEVATNFRTSEPSWSAYCSLLDSTRRFFSVCEQSREILSECSQAHRQRCCCWQASDQRFCDSRHQKICRSHAAFCQTPWGRTPLCTNSESQAVPPHRGRFPKLSQQCCDSFTAACHGGSLACEAHVSAHCMEMPHLFFF